MMVNSHARLRRIFESAVKISNAPERDAFLAKECCSDKSTLREVNSLLKAHSKCEGFLSELLPLSPADDLELYPAGTRVGPYRVRDLLGEGGMGLVYVAEQSAPVSRLVALKVVKPGMDSRQILRRFRTEMQSLAKMSHPNIARVLDGGITEDGRPYFVMELVSGTRVDHFCDHRSLSVIERIALFTTICQAVHHAHAKGIIHRDLKPANVLIEDHEGKLVPKVIDFGVAKALNEDADDGNMRTHVTQRVGTPAYMSPEQASETHQDVDIRSDVYSLGVLLYQTLTGTLPSDSNTTVADDATQGGQLLRRDVQAERPSRRLRKQNVEELTVAADRRNCRPDALVAHLKGELDWILLKALDPDRDRRYQSAYDLCRDLQRYLSNETVDACPPTLAYRLRKLGSRNRNSLVAAGAVVLAIAAGLFATSWYAFTAEQARRATSAALDLAERHASEAEAVSIRNSEFLYAADMKAAAEFLRNGDVRNSTELLRSYEVADPYAGDLRGFEWHFLHSQLGAPGKVVSASHEQACLVRYSPDRQTLLVGRSNGTVSLLDAADHTVVTSFDSQTGFVNDCSFHPDGKRVATIADDGFIRIWNLDSNSQEQFIPAFERHGNRVFFIGDGAVLAASGEAPEVRFWDAATGSRLPLEIDLSRADGPVEIKQRFAYSAPSRLIVACDGVEQAHIYDADSGELRVALEGVDKWHQVRLFAFSPHGQFVAAAMKDRTVCVWNSDSGRLLATFTGHRDQVLSLAFHPQGNVLASGDHGGIVRTWTIADGSQPQSGADAAWPAVFQAHDDRVLSLAFRQDGQSLITGSRDGTVAVFDRSPDSLRQVVPIAKPRDAEFLPGGRELVVLAEGSLHIWERRSGALRSLITFDDVAERLAVSSDGRLAATGHVGGITRVWDLQPGELRFEDRIEAPGFGRIDFSEDDRLLVSSTGEERDVRVYDVATGNPPQSFSGYRFGWLTPEGYPLLYRLNELHRLDPRTGKRLLTYHGHRSTVQGVACSTLGNRFVSGGDDRQLCVWDPKLPTPVHTIRAHESKISAVAMSPDGRTIVSGDETGHVWFSALNSGRAMFDTRFADSPIYELRFSPAGGTLAVVQRDQLTLATIDDNR